MYMIYNTGDLQCTPIYLHCTQSNQAGIQLIDFSYIVALAYN